MRHLSGYETYLDQVSLDTKFASLAVENECLVKFNLNVPGKAGADEERMVACDCEMCETSAGLELTRVSLVDEAGKARGHKILLA